MISTQYAVLSWQLRTSVFKLNFCLHNKPRFSFLSFSSLYLISRVACIVYRRLNIILYQCGLWRWLIWSLWGSSSLSLNGKNQNTNQFIDITYDTSYPIQCIKSIYFNTYWSTFLLDTIVEYHATIFSQFILLYSSHVCESMSFVSVIFLNIGSSKKIQWVYFE